MQQAPATGNAAGNEQATPGERFPRSAAWRARAHAVIPAGCHTYSKGDDQFPELSPGFIVRGDGCIVEDVDGNRFVDWGMGIRSVILGHGHPRVLEAAIAAMRAGTNFTRPSTLEVELAEALRKLIPCAEMVKFGKNGSDVTTAAVRLARAATGRDLVAFPFEEPFHSVDDWFIGLTEMDAGIPDETKRLSLRYSYGDLSSLELLFAAHPGQIAAVVTEPAMFEEPPVDYLQELARITQENGALLVFDEMITGFRWHASGAQAYYDVTPDLACFGKTLGNGFSVSALCGRRDVMRLGGFDHDEPRVFLLSLTHGGETHALAAGLATVSEIAEGDVVDHLWRVGAQLQGGLNDAAAAAGLAGIVRCVGYPCSPTLAFSPPDPDDAAGLRTLFLQETIARGILMPYIAPSLAHGPREVELTVAAAAEAFTRVERVVAGEPLSAHLVGEPARPVFRRFSR